MSIAVIILAGGEGRRIGGGKPLRRLGGERLIDRVLRQARQWSDAVAVALREGDAPEIVDAEILFDDPAVDGPLAGLVSGARFAATKGAELLLTLPVDVPFLPADLPQRLSAAMTDGVNAALPTSGGELHTVCGLWRVEALGAAGAYVRQGRRSLKGFAAMIGFVAVEWPAEPFDPFFNVNDPEQLALAERRVAQKSSSSTGS